MSLLQRSPKKTIDLNGPEGCAFQLLMTACSYSDMLKVEFETVSEEMMSDDYRHLVKTFDKYFGYCVDLILPSNWDQGS